jgi:hypothetical protein
MKKLLYLIIITFILLNVLNVNAQNWKSQQPLDERAGHAMSYVADNIVIMFGGSGSSGYLNDIWIFDSSTNTWTLANTGTSPLARAYHSMTYIGDDKVMMFGGEDADGNPLNDTWIFDLSDKSWDEIVINSTTIPSARNRHSMAYIGDEKVMMFGGSDADGYFNDTWIFYLSNSTWTKSSISTSPAARSSHSMAYIGNYKVLLFGGSGNSEFNDTWVYDYGTDGTDATWSQDNNGTNPSTRSLHTLAYLENDKALLFGGFGPGIPMNDSWVYDLNGGTDGTWTQIATETNPSARAYHSMAYIGNKKILLYGGYGGYDLNNYSLLNDTWLYFPTTLGTVTTTAISDITSTTATSGGNVTNDGGDEVTSRGVCWNTSGTPTTADNLTSDGTGINEFVSSMTGLTPGTNYYVCAYATNSVGTAYGEIISFATASNGIVPTVVCAVDISINADINSCTASKVDLGTPSLSDNSPVSSINNAPAEFPVGTTVVAWTLTDNSGNTYTCSQNVAVTDITPPTVITQNIKVTLSKGTAVITANDVNNGSYDACGIKSISVTNNQSLSTGRSASASDQITFDCNSIGEHTITLIVVDNNGNSGEGSALVSVESSNPLIIIDNPSDVTTCEDQSVSFKVNASGDGLTYQWRRNKVNLAGATTNSFSIPSVISDDAGIFDVVVTDFCGQSATSTSASLIVNTIPEVTKEPNDLNIATIGSDITISVDGSGIPTPSIQWQKSTDKGANWSNVVGATSATLTIKNVSIKQNMEMYHAVFTNSCGSIASRDASLQIKLVLNEIGPVELCISTPTDDKKGKHNKRCSPHHRKCDHRVNIKVELFKNGISDRNKITESEMLNQQGHGHESEKNSSQYTIPLPNLKNVTFAPNDYLYCKISVKRNKNGKDFPVRMWFNGAPHSKCSPVNKSWSRLHKVTVGGNTKNFYYFRWSEADILPLISSPGDKIKYIEVKATENYKEIETWRIMGSSMKELISAEDESTDEATNSDNNTDADHNRLQSELDAFELFPNYPNPFTDGTVVKYSLNQESDVALNFYDGAGRLIENAISSRYTKGTYYYTFYPRDNSSGYYVCVLTCNGVSKVVNLKLIK